MALYLASALQYTVWVKLKIELQPVLLIMFVFFGSFLYFLLPEQFNKIQLLSSQWSSCSAGILCMDVEGEPLDPCAYPDGFLIAELFKESI